MTVFLVMGGLIVDVIGMVTGELPQSNVMVPPAVTPAESAAKVQPEAAPAPILTVGLEVSTS
jgi:hypothetical protein